MKAYRNDAIRLSLRDRIALGILASILVIAGYLEGAWMPDGYDKERACADRIGIEWTREDGATEEIEAFQNCVMERGK